jgi:hypothetical protein
MKAKRAREFSHEDVSRLAFLNWEKDGCPQGHAINYWLEAEQQLKATWRLLVKESAPKKRSLISRRMVADKPKPRITIQISASPKAA